MKPLDLICVANALLKIGSSRPSQANLRRATSTLYYALFHCLARSCADLLVGGSGAARSDKAWRQTYRALEHNLAEKACRNGSVIVRFPDGIRDFANAFVALQKKRHDADYDPHAAKLSKSEVQADIALAEQVIADYQAVKASDKRAFCIYVLFKVRGK